MSVSVAVLGIAGALAVGVISPGPSFVMVARTAVSRSRVHGLFAALGMGVAGVLFSIAAIVGLQALFVAVPGVYLALKVCGGAYLLYMGIRVWQGARNELTVAGCANGEAEQKVGRAFLMGFVTQVSNPKTAIVYASVFSTFLPQDVPTSLLLIVPVLVFVIETGWYALVAVGLSSAAPRAAYLRYKAWVDRVVGGVLSLLGLKLVSSAYES